MKGTAGLEGLVTVREPESSPRPQVVWDDATVVGHRLISRYHRVMLHSPSIARSSRAGQFVMITLPNSDESRFLLPRPMAIHRRYPVDGNLEVIYKVVGAGTAALAEIELGDELLLTGPLGRGFEIPDGAHNILLLGRGIGICAVMGVAEDANADGFAVTAVLSSSVREAVIGVDDCAELGAKAIPVTDEDGSSAPAAVKEAMYSEFAERRPDVIMVCGSARLTRLAAELSAEWQVPAQVSLEAHMACGLGYCHGCAAPVATSKSEEGPLVCLDGPVFDVVPG